MNPFEPQFNDAVPEGGQQPVGYNPTKTYDISQEILQEYERNEKNRRFFDTSMVERLRTSITNKEQETRDVEAYYKSLEPLKDFSGTLKKLADQSIELEKERRKKQAQFEVATRVWEQGATDEEQQEYSEGQAEAAEDSATRSLAADESIRETGKTDIAAWINSSDPYTAQYRAEALATQAGVGYQPWLDNALRTNTDILPGFGIPVNQARGEVERKAAVTYLRGLYLSTSGLGIINPALIDDKVYPVMKSGEGSVLQRALKDDRIALGEETRQELNAGIGPTMDLNRYVSGLAQTSDQNGNPLGYASAWKLAKEQIALAVVNGRMPPEALEALGDTIDPVTGKPLREARPNFIPDVEAEIDDIRAGRSQNRYYLELGQLRDIEKAEIAKLDPDRTYTPEQRRKLLQRLRYQYPGYTFPNLERFLGGASPEQLGREQAQRYRDMADNNIPFTLQEYYDAVPVTQRDPRVEAQAIDSKEQDSFEDAKKQFFPTALQQSIALLPSKWPRQTQRYRWILTERWEYHYQQAQIDNPDGNSTLWGQQASDRLVQEVIDSKGDSDSPLYVDQTTGEMNYSGQQTGEELDKADSQSFETMTLEAKEDGVTLSTVRTDENSGEIVGTEFFTRDELESLEDRLVSGDFPNAWRFAKLAKIYGVPVSTVINSQLKAMGLPEIAPEALQRLSQTPPADIAYMSGPTGSGGYMPTSRIIGDLNLGDGQYNSSAPFIRGEDPNPIIIESAQEFGIPPSIIASLLQQESGFSDDVIFGQRHSSAGAIGIAQFLPGTAAQMGIDPYDWKQSIRGAAKYLRHLMDNYGFDLETAIYAYNAGPGTVLNYGVGATEENANYAPEIIERARNNYRSLLIRMYRYGDQEVLTHPLVTRPEFIGII